MGKRHRDSEDEESKHRKKGKKKNKRKNHKKRAQDYCSSTFFAACREGDLKGVKRHLRHDPALFVRTNALGNSCLHLACEFGHAQLASYFYGKGRRAHLSRTNHCGLTPEDLGLNALLQQSDNTTESSSNTTKAKKQKKKKKKKDERSRRDSRPGPSSPSSSTSSPGVLDEAAERKGGYTDPHADISGLGEGTAPRAAAQWRKMWEQERRSDEQEWAEKLAEEAAAESAEWGWGGSGPGTNGMGWGGQANQWAEEEQADATAREDWMDEIAAEMHRKRAMESDVKRRRRAEEQAASGHKKQQYGDDHGREAHSQPRPHNGGAGRSSGIPGHRPGVGSTGSDFAGMRGATSAGAGPTRESAAVINARLRAFRQSDEERWEGFIEKFGRRVSKHQHGRGPQGRSNEPPAPPATNGPELQVPLREADIPWPQGMEEGTATGAAGSRRDTGANVLSLPSDLAAADVKVAVRTAQRRWHPDKFAQRFGDAMASLVGGEDERVRVLEKVKLLAQKINEIPIPETDDATKIGEESEHVGPSRPPAT